MKSKPVKVSQYKTVWRGEIFTVQRARAVYPSGQTKMFERVIRPGSVIVLAIDKHKRLLLTREYRLKQKKYTWRVPTGRMNEGEKPTAAAQRELREEAGVRAGRLRLFRVSDPSQTLQWKRYTFVATDLAPAKLVGDEDEDIRVVPTPLSKVRQMVLAGKIENEVLESVLLKLCRERKKWVK